MNEAAVDACCLINLLAAGEILPKQGARGRSPAAELSAQGELKSLGLILHVPSLVAAETYYIHQPDSDDPARLVKTAVDLGPYFDEGLLQRCDITPGDETSLFVEYASRLDDGEATCVALAKSRGWLLATDDRPATALAKQENISVVTTAELLHRWATRSKSASHVVRAALLNIQRFAKFVPRAGSPRAVWWTSSVRND